MATPSEILIAGAGIGGLTLACALRRAGFETRIVERAPELGAAGAGLTLQSNAVRALGLIDLAEPVQSAGHCFEGGELRRADGTTLGQLGFDGLVESVGAPMVGIHRAALQAILLEGAGPVETGATLTDFDVGERVTVTLADGAEREADVLVGADGIHSAVRAKLHGHQEPRYAGYTCWRGIASVPAGSLPGSDCFEAWGRGHRFGAVRIDPERIYWFAVANAPRGTASAPEERKAVVSQHLAAFASPVPELLEATEETTILHNDIIDRPTLSRWGEGPVTLLGDAAHPMTPNMGQGACQAIEDAVVLAASLASRPTEPVAALRDYERARMKRANAFVVRSWRFGKMGQWSNPAACWLRNLLVRLTPTSVMERQLRHALTMTAVEASALDRRLLPSQ